MLSRTVVVSAHIVLLALALFVEEAENVIITAPMFLRDIGQGGYG